jgi:hypothetical protein
MVMPVHSKNPNNNNNNQNNNKNNNKNSYGKKNICLARYLKPVSGKKYRSHFFTQDMALKY